MMMKHIHEMVQENPKVAEVPLFVDAIEFYRSCTNQGKPPDLFGQTMANCIKFISNSSANNVYLILFNLLERRSSDNGFVIGRVAARLQASFPRGKGYRFGVAPEVLNGRSSASN